MNKEFINIYIEGSLLQLIITKDIPFIILNDKEKLIEFVGDVTIIKKALEELESGNFSRIILHHDNLEELFEKVKSFYTTVAAAGGVVQNDKNEILSIFRRGNWDFPKGKIEVGEKKKDCAIREVKEECGLSKVEIVKKLGTTYHTYGNPKSRKLKVSTWYVMHSNDKKLVPQTEEDIEQVKWFKLGDFILHAKPVYKNISDVFEAYVLKYT